ncbi:hypothetical protein VTK26DRAFT_3885 [Humicola hyalothermophila]
MSGKKDEPPAYGAPPQPPQPAYGGGPQPPYNTYPGGDGGAAAGYYQSGPQMGYGPQPPPPPPPGQYYAPGPGGPRRGSLGR